jgi:RNA polymerase sigma factor (sigma-70 family)
LFEEAELLKRAATGDEAAAAELYDRYSPALMRFLAITLGDAQAAEDVLQEAFLYVFKSAEKYDPTQSALATWLRCVALSLARNELRRRRRKPAVSLDTPVEETSGRLRPISERLSAKSTDRDQREASARVLQILNGLPEEDREVLILRYVEGLPPREISAVLGISPKAVSMRIWRAVKELQGSLRDE